MDLEAVEGVTHTRSQKRGQYRCTELQPSSRESVIGKFRSTLASSYQDLFSSVRPAPASNPARTKRNIDKNDMMDFSQQRRSPVDRKSKDMQIQVESDGTLLSEMRDPSLLSTQSMMSSVNNTKDRNVICPRTESIPLEAYLAQQNEIDQLRAQVARLQEQLALCSPRAASAVASSVPVSLQRPHQCDSHEMTAVDLSKVDGVGKTSQVVETTHLQQQLQQPQQQPQQQQQPQNSENGTEEVSVSALDPTRHPGGLDISVCTFDESTHAASRSGRSATLEEDEEIESHVSVQFVRESFQPLEAPSMFDLDLFTSSTDKKKASKQSKTASSNSLSSSALTHKSGGKFALGVKNYCAL